MCCASLWCMHVCEVTEVWDPRCGCLLLGSAVAVLGEVVLNCQLEMKGTCSHSPVLAP